MIHLFTNPYLGIRLYLQVFGIKDFSIILNKAGGGRSASQPIAFTMIGAVILLVGFIMQFVKQQKSTDLENRLAWIPPVGIWKTIGTRKG